MPATARRTSTIRMTHAMRATRGVRTSHGGERRVRATSIHSATPSAGPQLSLLDTNDMRTAAINEPNADYCDWCLRNGPKGCPACLVRQRKAARLAASGRSPAEIAAEMRIPERRVARLLEQHADREALKQYRGSANVDNRRIRALVEERLARDSDLTLAEIARLAEYSCASHLERDLGILPTSTKVVGDKTYGARLKDTISVQNAGRIVRALGYLPVEIEEL